MAFEIVHLPDQDLLIVRYGAAHNAQEAEDITRAMETHAPYAACTKFLVDLSRVQTVEVAPAGRANRVTRLHSALWQAGVKDTLILVCYYAPKSPGLELARSFQPQWNTREGIVSIASHRLADCATFLDVSLPEEMALAP